ncbi:uncharacterized protein CG16817 [Episyrphus balteatus]|uniref:uncharacterized protein CG16817 n=1 Tax=Episyrphus balteatus TaxID=286459 RepID=UPI00248603BE|nr:uncharacterized protein CG16817 [Episyrphus balteatus]
MAPVVSHPPVSWAQRNDLLFVTIEVECKDIDYKVTDDSMKFTGKDALDSNKVYELQLNFLKNVDPERVTSKNIGRCLEFTIYKKESGPYWSSLTNDKTKLHFLKANFNKWKDESDDEDQETAMESEWPNFMNQASDLKNFDDFEEDDDSDDNIPSLSQNDEDDEADDKPKEEKTDKPAAAEEKK